MTSRDSKNQGFNRIQFYSFNRGLDFRKEVAKAAIIASYSKSENINEKVRDSFSFPIHTWTVKIATKNNNHD